MEEKIQKSKKLSDIKDITYQKTPQGNALLVTKLQQKVARLEIALKDKDDKLTKLEESTKASYVNELKIQTEMYFQEAMRVRNELNKISLNQNQYHHIPTIDEPSNRRPLKYDQENKELTPRGLDRRMMVSMEKLRKDNHSLSSKLATVQNEKEKLAAEHKKIMNQMKLSKRKPGLRDTSTQTQVKHSSENTQMNTDVLNSLKRQIDELQRREKTWEEERATYKDLVLNLKEDRVFYKDSSQKRHEEFWTLQQELQKLQKEVEEFQSNGKPFCKQCSRHSYLHNKTKKLTLKDKETTRVPRVSNPAYRRTRSAECSSSSKISSSMSSKRLPNSNKSIITKDDSKSSRSSSLNSSCSNSPQLSPTHSSKDSPTSKHKTDKRTSTKTSGSSSTTTTSHSPSKAQKPPPHPPVAKRTLRKSDALRSPEKHNRSNDDAKVQVEQMANKPSISRSSSQTTSNYVSSLEKDEEIAEEILRHVETPEFNETVVKSDVRTENTSQSVEHSSPPEVEKEDKSVSKTDSNSSHESLIEENIYHTPDRKLEKSNVDSEAILSLFESHMSRKRKLEDLKAEVRREVPQSYNKDQKTSSSFSPQNNPFSEESPKPSSDYSYLKKGPKSMIKSSSKISSKTTNKKEELPSNKSSKSTNRIDESPTNISSKSTNKLQESPLMTSLQTSSKIPPPKPKRSFAAEPKDALESPTLKPNNDIEKVVSLLEGHMTRQAFVSLKKKIY